MTVTWVTLNATQVPVVEYGTNYLLSQSANGTSTLFTDGGDEKRSMFIHRAIMKDLIPGEKYCNLKISLTSKNYF